MQPDALINLAGNLSAVGFIIWLAHRLTTKTIPEMTERFQKATESQREDFRQTLEKQRADFADFHKREHDAHESRLQAVMDRCLARTGEN